MMGLVGFLGLFLFVVSISLVYSDRKVRDIAQDDEVLFTVRIGFLAGVFFFSVLAAILISGMFLVVIGQ